MITNGLYLFNSKALDGFYGGAVGVLMLHDGKLHGGDSFFYFIGTYSCSDGKLKVK
jgi:T3SS negative regulator,GrlR